MGYVSACYGLVSLVLIFILIVPGTIEYFIRMWLTYVNDSDKTETQIHRYAGILLESIFDFTTLPALLIIYSGIGSAFAVFYAIVVDAAAFNALAVLDYVLIPVILLCGSAKLVRNHKRLQAKYNARIRELSNKD